MFKYTRPPYDLFTPHWLNINTSIIVETYLIKTLKGRYDKIDAYAFAKIVLLHTVLYLHSLGPNIIIIIIIFNCDLWTKRNGIRILLILACQLLNVAEHYTTQKEYKI